MFFRREPSSPPVATFYSPPSPQASTSHHPLDFRASCEYKTQYQVYLTCTTYGGGHYRNQTCSKRMFKPVWNINDFRADDGGFTLLLNY